MVELRNIGIAKAGKRLLENFSWTINENEHWVLSGTNGSGKTLLLELLAGSIHPVQGEITCDFIHGTTWDERYAERKQKILYIPAHAIQAFLQHHELFYQQRYYSIGDERIPLVRDLFGEDVKRLHILDFPASFNIDQLLNLEVTRLSNGQLKKVLILKSLVHALPKLLLLDYPFEGLDYRSREDLITFLDHLAEAYAINIVLADHEHHLPSVINRRLVLNEGRIQAIESVQQKHETPTPPVQQPSKGNGIPVVEMKDVTIRYGERDILRDLNWKIHRGERWALTGRNGSGKTTLFSLIYADHPMAYSQQVYLFGKRRGTGESIWDVKRRINYLGPELSSYLNPQYITMSAREYILGQNRGLSLQKLNAIVDYFEAGVFIEKPVKHLSSGQLQLMLIIHGLVSDKELLLLDEPFQFLDTRTKERVNDYLQEHLHPETTLVLITHYERDIARWTRHRLHIGG
ncbi:MAG TPA: ATP-binding cassette domain-containing protein [Ohtaekwangia sp.]|uniref:ATP-binding cassette domain-containing protein n=1 Tax=Ohtaekwangia sp. TaxID=2066019 RepID=UPI002F955B05